MGAVQLNEEDKEIIHNKLLALVLWSKRARDRYALDDSKKCKEALVWVQKGLDEIGGIL